MRCVRKAPTMQNLRLEVRVKLKQHDENRIENGIGNGIKFCKVRTPGVVQTPGAKMTQDASRVCGSISRALRLHHGAKMGEDSAKMGQVKAKVTPKLANSNPRWPT